jgi:hypothetical protein
VNAGLRLSCLVAGMAAGADSIDDMDVLRHGAMTELLGAIRSGGARFSVTVPARRKVRAAIAAISEDAWTPVTCPRAVRDGDQGRLISDAQVAEVPCTALASRKGRAVTAWLIVRRVRDLSCQAPRGQGELFPAWRCHPVFTDSPFQTIQAEARTATTPSSSRSSPASATDRSPACPRGTSRPTPHGRPAPPSATT